MQVCTSLQTDSHASTLPLTFYRPDALPATQPTASKHWRYKHWRHKHWRQLQVSLVWHVNSCRLPSLRRTYGMVGWYDAACMVIDWAACVRMIGVRLLFPGWVVSTTLSLHYCGHGSAEVTAAWSWLASVLIGTGTEIPENYIIIWPTDYLSYRLCLNTEICTDSCLAQS